MLASKLILLSLQRVLVFNEFPVFRSIIFFCLLSVLI